MPLAASISKHVRLFGATHNNFVKLVGRRNTKRLLNSEAHLESGLFSHPLTRPLTCLPRGLFPWALKILGPLSSLSLWKPVLCLPNPGSWAAFQEWTVGTTWMRSGWDFTEGVSYLREHRAAQCHLCYIGKRKDQNPSKLWPQFGFPIVRNWSKGMRSYQSFGISEIPGLDLRENDSFKKDQRGTSVNRWAKVPQARGQLMHHN